MSTRTLLRSTIAFLAALFLSASAHAQLFRAYLAPDGNDANPCTLAQPCRLLPAALTAVASGGEIWMLDSANYNTATVTIGKSVSILVVPGAVGSVVAIGGPAISITANDIDLTLRNLVIVPLTGGGGTQGISMTGASNLTIEQCLVAKLPSHGVFVLGAGTVKIVDTIIRNSTGYGVFLQDGVKGAISRTHLLANASGNVVARTTLPGTTTASVTDSVISGGTEGLLAYADGDATSNARIFVTRSTIEDTSFALDSVAVAGSAAITVSYSTVTNNSFGWHIGGADRAFIKTLGNNHIADNTNAPVGVLTPTSLQ